MLKKVELANSYIIWLEKKNEDSSEKENTTG